MGKKLEGAGLRGQVAGETALSTVGKEGKGLTYRGYAIEDLTEKATLKKLPTCFFTENYQIKMSMTLIPLSLGTIGIYPES